MKVKFIKTLVFILITIVLNSFCLIRVLYAQELVVNSLFSDHMVIQQNSNAAFWGNAVPKSKLRISGSWGEETNTYSTLNGNWFAELKTPSAGGPYLIKISTDIDTTIIKDVMIGEVWICSGQSNMQMPLKGNLPNELIDDSERIY